MSIKIAACTILIFFIIRVANCQTPSFQWVKNMGGASFDGGSSIAVHGSGNLVITGTFSGTADFDPGPASATFTSKGASDVFITKLDGSGNFIWARAIGDTLGIGSSAVTIDPAGYIYTAGTFEGTVDFDPGPGTFYLNSSGNTDIFILKLDVSGDFIWAYKIGGTMHDIVRAVKVDAAKNIYATGWFRGTTDFDPGPGIVNLTSNGQEDSFILKLDSIGTLKWAHNIGGVSGDGGSALAINGSGIYATGHFRGAVDFDPGTGNSVLTATGSFDIFVCKYDANGNLIFARNMGGGASGVASYGIAVDVSGNILTTGAYSGTTDFDPGAGTFTLSGYGSTFISKLDVNGNFVWAKGIIPNTTGLSIATDLMDNVYIIGGFGYNVDFDPGPGTVNLSAVGNNDIFVLKLDYTGHYVWVKTMGGASSESASSLAISGSDIYTTGSFNFTCDFDPGQDTFNLSTIGFPDVFVHKLGVNTTGINEHENKKITVFPNPSNGTYTLLNLPANSLFIEVYGYTGNLILKQIVSGEKNTIDLTNQRYGVYFLRVVGNGQIVLPVKLVRE